jgi:DNA-directed RNA polymerase subunit K/omega
MIDSLKNDDIILKAGGRFKLTALIQKRWLELMHDNRPMIETKGLSDLEVVIEEIVQGKIEPQILTRDQSGDESD